MRSPMRVRLACVTALSIVAGAGCRSSPPPADRVVYEVREVPVYVDRGPVIPPAGPSIRDDPAAEAARRRWLEENYGPRRGSTGGEVVTERYVPRREVEPARVIVVERDRSPRYWLPPINLALGYWHGSGGHHGHRGWSWGLSTGWPYWGW